MSYTAKSYTETTTTTVTKSYAPASRATSSPEQGRGSQSPVTRIQRHTATSARSSTPQTNNGRVENTTTGHICTSQASRMAPLPATPTASVTTSRCSTLTMASRSTNSTELRSHGILHPMHLPCPPEGKYIKKFYLVTAGSEVGIFFEWPKTHSVTSGIPGNSQKAYRTWDEALREYTNAYNENHLRVISGGLTAGGLAREQTTRLLSPSLHANSDEGRKIFGACWRQMAYAGRTASLHDTFEDVFTDTDYDQVPALCKGLADM
ncbi:hypothetical protein JOM56_014725 [Amanita muscaria]